MVQLPHERYPHHSSHEHRTQIFDRFYADQVAAAVAERFTHGVTFVDLVPLRDAALVIPAIAQAFGLRETAHRGSTTGEWGGTTANGDGGAGGAVGDTLLQTLVAFLWDKHVLLVLDNCEHVLDAVPVLGQLVRACPRLSVLATSRATLQITGEHEYAVGSLDLPAAQYVRPAELLETRSIS